MTKKHFKNQKFNPNKSRTIFIPMNQSVLELPEPNQLQLLKNNLENSKKLTKNKSHNWIKKPSRKENKNSSNLKYLLVHYPIHHLLHIMESQHSKHTEEVLLVIT